MKSILKMTYLMKTSETKKFVQIFCEAFLFLKNILLQPSRTYFHFYKKGFLNSQAVRIRVKVFGYAKIPKTFSFFIASLFKIFLKYCICY
jgi:hypothetical protein